MFILFNLDESKTLSIKVSCKNVNYYKCSQNGNVGHYWYKNCIEFICHMHFLIIMFIDV